MNLTHSLAVVIARPSDTAVTVGACRGLPACAIRRAGGRGLPGDPPGLGPGRAGGADLLGPVDWDDDRVPDRLRCVDLRAGLTRAGFVDVAVDERPGWQAVEEA